MMDAWKNFLSDLLRIDFLRLARDEAIEDWGVDIPTTILFANLGKKVAEKFDELLPEDRAYIFNAIEAGMKQDDVTLKTFIATGLLEALFSRASKETALWMRMDTYLGDASRNYLVDWGKPHGN